MWTADLFSFNLTRYDRVCIFFSSTESVMKIKCQPNGPSWPLKQLCQGCLKISFRVYWSRPNTLTSLLPSGASLSQLYNTSHRAKLHTDTSRWLLLFPTHNLPNPHRDIAFFHPALSQQHARTHTHTNTGLHSHHCCKIAGRLIQFLTPTIRSDVIVCCIMTPLQIQDWLQKRSTIGSTNTIIPTHTELVLLYFGGPSSEIHLLNTVF